MFNTVLPLIARNKLAANARRVSPLNTGHRALIYPASPVAKRSPVWGLFIMDQYSFVRLWAFEI
jgi:hypothetical protein